MKYLLATLLVIAGLSASAQSQPIKVAEGFKIEIQTSAICMMCKDRIEEDLAFEKGVKSSDLNLDNKVVTVVYNPKKTDANTIRERIAEVGYHADQFQRNPEAYEKLPMCCKDGGHGSHH